MCVCSFCNPACYARAPYCHLWPAQLDNIFSRHFINGTIFEIKLFNIKCLLLLSLQTLLKHFLFSEELSEMSQIYFGLHVKYPLFLTDFN